MTPTTWSPPADDGIGHAGYVALTFDDGPTGDTTDALLGTLREVGARATFFDLGRQAERHPGLVQAQHAAGMWIGNHSWSHPHLPGMAATEMAAEIRRTQGLLTHLTGTVPVLFRPPYLDSDEALRSVQAQHGLVEVGTDVCSRDWARIPTAEIVRNVGSARAGDVILMHDWWPDTLAAIPRIVADLAARGLRPGMISPTTGRAVAPEPRDTLANQT